MTRRPNCIDAEWVGRADCIHCAVRRLMLFSELPENAFEHLLSPIDNYRHRKGSILCVEGSNDGAVFTIRSGLVKLLNDKPDGVQRIVRLLGRGSVLGLELLDGSTGYRHSAIAVTDIDICRIPVDTLVQLEKRYSDICHQIRLQLQDNLDHADQWIIALNTGPAKNRVAHLLLMLHEFSTHANGDIEILGRDDMAAIIGSTPETVSRIIADLKRRNIVSKIENNQHRLDTNALQAITGE